MHFTKLSQPEPSFTVPGLNRGTPARGTIDLLELRASGSGVANPPFIDIRSLAGDVHSPRHNTPQ